MLRWTDDAWNDYLYWQVQDKKTLKRVNALIRDAMRSPFAGLGKPEPLKYELAGKWSRRINSEHRLIYSVHNDMIEIYIFSMKYHHSKK